MEQDVKSTVTEGLAHLVQTIPIAPIIDGYRQAYKIDVSDYFSGDRLPIYECDQTGYRFFHPASLAGREDLYAHLQAGDWNVYKSDKWEYRKALSFLSKGWSVLDVGCGTGQFVKLASETGLKTSGIEFNSSAVKAAKNAGLDVFEEDIRSHSGRVGSIYDAVCCFQVLEHVYDVRGFITACLSALKPSGLLIFGVPNNASFLRYADQAVLNRPPHHMGLWTPKSLSKLPKVFNIALKRIELEPLAEIDWYCAVMEQRFMPRRMRAIYYKMGFDNVARTLIKLSSARIAGHTVLGAYVKAP
jgi:2-polyprenyl-3-methyl-5-hydroxy-6-metoxy-1,4-benzoquinol methylase